MIAALEHRPPSATTPTPAGKTWQERLRAFLQTPCPPSDLVGWARENKLDYVEDVKTQVSDWVEEGTCAMWGEGATKRYCTRLDATTESALRKPEPTKREAIVPVVLGRVGVVDPVGAARAPAEVVSSPAAPPSGLYVVRVPVSLDDKLQEASTALSAAVVGEVRAAQILCELEQDWDDQYKTETRQTWGGWVNKHFGGKARRFRSIASAITTLQPYWSGTDLYTKFSPDSLLRVAQAPEEQRKACLLALREAARKQDGIPVEGPRAANALRRVLGAQKARPQAVDKAALQKLWSQATQEIARLGGTVPEIPQHLSWLLAQSPDAEPANKDEPHVTKR